MINWRQISKLLGILLFIEAGQLLVTMGVSIFYDEDIIPFLTTIILAIVLGVSGRYAGRKAGTNMSRKDGYIIVSAVWMLFTLVGMLPFIISGSIKDVAGAFFETMSGFTSTGATVIDNIDTLPKGILFWRSMTQWIGGIGIIFFTIAILPAFGAGEVKLFAAEATGPLHDKVHPRISVAVKWIGSVYLGLTVACVACLIACGMSVFDAVNISMTTTATGGFAPHSAFFHSAYSENAMIIEYVVTFFMLCSGMNYTLLYYSILKGKIRKFFNDPELRCYLRIVGVCVVICTFALIIHKGLTLQNIELAFRESAFTIISIQTTTGFANCDYTLWPQILMPILVFVMFAGACSGSTSGGFKCIRWALLWEIMRNEFTRILHPRAVIPVKLNGVVIISPVQKTLLAFCTLFVGTLFVGTFILILCGVRYDSQYTEAFSLALSSISNVGPAMDYFGPAHSWSIINPAAKVVCGILMLVGRLEIFPIFILFAKNFWKKD